MFRFLLRYRSYEIRHIICQNARLSKYIDFYNQSEAGISSSKPENDKNPMQFSHLFIALSPIFFLTFLINGVQELSVSYMKTLISMSTTIYVTGTKSVSQLTSQKLEKIETDYLIRCCSYFSVLPHFSPRQSHETGLTTYPNTRIDKYFDFYNQIEVQILPNKPGNIKNRE